MGNWYLCLLACVIAHVAGQTCLDGVQNGNEAGVDCGGSCAACNPRILTIGLLTPVNGTVIDPPIDAKDLFRPPAVPTDVTSPWMGPLDPPLQKPQSHRILYVPWYSDRLGVNPGGLTPAFTAPAGGASQLLITLSSPISNTLHDNFRIKLEAPWLEVDPWNCGKTGVQQFGNCRCNPPQKDPYTAGGQWQVITTVDVNGNPTGWDSILPSVIATDAAQGKITFQLPYWTYFEHTPFPGQHPYLRTYRKLCFGTSASANTGWMDTTLWIAVIHACDVTQTNPNFQCGTPVKTNQNLAVIFNPLTAAPSYNFLGSGTPNTFPNDWECNTAGYLGEFADFRSTGLPLPVTPTAPETCWGETREMTQTRYQRSACCGAFGTILGVCYNPQIENCCGFKPFNPRFEQCCAKSFSRINYIEQACRCSSASIIADCQQSGSNLMTSADFRGITDAWKTTQNCCTLTKYSELNTMTKYGSCYDTTSPVIKCCDDGHTYDNGVAQCCPVNGVQSLNTPCPCNTDAHCPQTPLISEAQRCCLQEWPRNWDEGQGPSAGQCDPYSNWPDGSSPAEVQRCLGTCFDTNYETCCNGRICVKEYERCCNSTCCNRFTSGCMEGTRPGAWGYGGRVNPNDYLVWFESCTAKEVFTTRRAYWVWVMPTFWTIASMVALAIVTVVARRATENVFELTERAMVFFAVLLIFLNIPHYFSPTYKYGIVIVFVSLFAIVGAVMRSKKMSLVTLILVFALLLLWIDPFNGNIYLSLTGGRSPIVPPAPVSTFNYTSGIIEALFRLERNRTECTGFYDFFVNDMFVHDFERVWNPAKTTFGYCTRAWMTTLLIFSIMSLAGVLILLMLAACSYAKKLMPTSAREDLTFEVRPMPEYAY